MASTKVRKKPTQDLLPKLAAKIERLHQAAYGAAAYALDRALRCGDLLIEAKGKVKHGEWLPWLKANTTVSARQAQKYMQLAEHRAEVERGKYAPGAHLPINDAVALLAKPKASEPEDEEEEDEEEEDEADPFPQDLSDMKREGSRTDPWFLL